MFDVIKVCPFCGNPNGVTFGCCEENIGYGLYVITDDPDEDAVYFTEVEADVRSDELLLDYQRNKGKQNV